MEGGGAMTETISDEEQYVPPETLPPPIRPEAGFPLLAILLGSLAAVGLGVAFYLVTSFIYIYILFNALLGIGIGMVIAYGIGTVKYRGIPLLLLLTGACSFLAYLTYNIVLMEAMLSYGPGQSPGFIEFLKFRAANEPFIGGMQIGTIGSYTVWAAEFLITWYFAWTRVSVKMRLMDIDSVPPEVAEFLLYLSAERGLDLDEMEKELAARGWADPEDQHRAFTAVNSLVSLMSEAQEDEETEEEEKTGQPHPGDHQPGAVSG
jgi:hypothetical protein